ncbi:MAG: sigma-54-dependent Fis family transcriptional regulator, partial [Polyangiaceae bacterium]
AEQLSRRGQVRLLRQLDAPGTRPRRLAGGPPGGVRIITLTREQLAPGAISTELLDSLHYRLDGVHLRVPALRERGPDLLPLVAQLLGEIDSSDNRPPGLTDAAWRALASYPFPGNVRELRWALEHALVTSDGGPIDARHLPDEIRAGTA